MALSTPQIIKDLISTGGVCTCALTSVQAGALLLIVTTVSDDINSAPANCAVSGSSLTYVKLTRAAAAGSGTVEIWSAFFPAGGSITVTADWSAGVSKLATLTVYEVRGSELILGGASNTANNQTAPSVAITTTRANSILFCGTCDWSGTDGGSRVYRDSATEDLYKVYPGDATNYHYQKVTTTVQAYTEGLTAPSTMAAGTAVVEIREPASVSVPKRKNINQAVNRSNTY